MTQVLSRRLWGMVALISATLAIPAQSLRLHHAGKCLMLPARALQDFGTSEPVRPVVSHHVQASGFWGLIAAILILFAIVCWITAYLRGEAVPRLGLIILLLVDLSLAFLIV
jgi:hypothetical protein